MPAADTQQGRFFFVKFEAATGKAVSVITPREGEKPFEKRPERPPGSMLEHVEVWGGQTCVRKADGTMVCW